MRAPDLLSQSFTGYKSGKRNLGLNLANYNKYQISANERVDIQLKAPQNIIAIANLKQGTQELTESAVLMISNR